MKKKSKPAKKKGLSPGLLAYMAKQKALKAAKGGKAVKITVKPTPKQNTRTPKARPSKQRKRASRKARPLYTNTGVAGIVPPIPEKRIAEPTQARSRPLY